MEHLKTFNMSDTFCANAYLAGLAPGANIVKKSSPWEWGPLYCAPDFNIAPLVI